MPQEVELLVCFGVGLVSHMVDCSEVPCKIQPDLRLYCWINSKPVQLDQESVKNIIVQEECILERFVSTQNQHTLQQNTKTYSILYFIFLSRPFLIDLTFFLLSRQILHLTSILVLHLSITFFILLSLFLFTNNTRGLTSLMGGSKGNLRIWFVGGKWSFK